ncbi:ABC transporter ATP-binding protein [Gallaecimonas mangrovi]|uniref:ABC transporter ATP-binding protein n=1 Tax=Gallaecimonas mangrovi TaxID=2291597 RepID=UPI0018678DD7|nr:ABC transporter ATP-binding protein [Gallaecimonas mangrovi]
MTSQVIKLEQLSQAFGRQTILDSLTTEVHSGEVIGLLGLNGAGKTTLLETLLGFALPSQGQSLVFGESAERMSANCKSRIGFVPQQDELLDALTGQQNLDLIASFYANWHGEWIADLANSWQVPLNKRASQLSLGQRQKLSILAAIGHQPALLLLDEPVASLDPLARRQFLQTLIELISDLNCTVLFSTHIVSDVERIAGRIWLLKDKKLLLDEPLDSLKDSIVKVGPKADIAGVELVCEHADGSKIVRGFNGAGALHLGLEDLFIELCQ